MNPHGTTPLIQPNTVIAVTRLLGWAGQSGKPDTDKAVMGCVCGQLLTDCSQLSNLEKANSLSLKKKRIKLIHGEEYPCY